jgi:putative PEP-CTERM system TPR-repeat lipoprotein
LGNAYLRDGKLTQALELGAEAVAIAPQNVGALLLLGRSQLASGDHDAAISTTQTLLATHPDVVLGHIVVARAKIKKGDFDGARAILRDQLKANPKNLAALQSMFEINARSGKSDKATKIARQIQAFYPELGMGYVFEGDVLVIEGKLSEAGEKYRAGLGKSPSIDILLRLSGVYQGLGDPDSARTALTEWLDAHPTDERVRRALGNLEYTIGNRDAARQHYEVILKSEPENWLVLNNLALIYEASDTGRATELARAATKVAPGNGNVADTYGWLLVKSGSTQQGLKVLREAARLEPHDPTIQFHFAVALARSGERPESKQVLEELLENHQEFSDKESALALHKSL